MEPGDIGGGSSGGDGRRTLLVIYIHGFMGNDGSFQRFPAHIHEFLRDSLAATHAVHTKIYPRYKTYRAIDVATENFSRWLEPHESPTTDVVLVGHSMGGLLAADVVLLPPREVTTSTHPLRHRILGTVSLDSPFLGLHPGIVAAGIASLFRKSDQPPNGDAWAGIDSSGAAPARSPHFPPLSPSLSPDPSMYGDPPDDLTPLQSAGSSTVALSYFPSASSKDSSSSVNSIISIARSATAVGRSDPHYNPPFFNDVMFKDRGFLRNVWHFAQKRKIEGENLIDAAIEHIVRHLQFGKCLADIRGLHSRYDAIRALEDVDDYDAGNIRGGRRTKARVRFVNYYTVSTGRIKTPKPRSRAVSRPPSQRAPGVSSDETLSTISTGAELEPPEKQLDERQSESPRVATPRISIQDTDDTSSKSEERRGSDDRSGTELEILEPGSYIVEDKPRPESTGDPIGKQKEKAESVIEDTGLKPIPDLPEEPKAPELPEDTNAEERKRAEKEHKQARKAYDQAVKAREKAIRERNKEIEKRRVRAEKEVKKREREEQKRLQQEEKKREKEEAQRLKQKEKESPDTEEGIDAVQHSELALRQAAEVVVAGEQSGDSKEDGDEKKKKPRKFCMLPRKRSDGSRDSAWVEVYMEGVDEIGAHCGLFFPGPHYEKLVGDVGMRIRGWVEDEATRRAILEDDG